MNVPTCAPQRKRSRAHLSKRLAYFGQAGNVLQRQIENDVQQNWTRETREKIDVSLQYVFYMLQHVTTHDARDFHWKEVREVEEFIEESGRKMRGNSQAYFEFVRRPRSPSES